MVDGTEDEPVCTDFEVVVVDEVAALGVEEQLANTSTNKGLVSSETTFLEIDIVPSFARCSLSAAVTVGDAVVDVLVVP